MGEEREHGVFLKRHKHFYSYVNDVNSPIRSCLGTKEDRIAMRLDKTRRFNYYGKRKEQLLEVNYRHVRDFSYDGVDLFHFSEDSMFQRDFVN